MSNYYEMRDAKVKIANELMNRGWEVKGYKPDESDSMTDYYSPANWDGVATKNGFILCIDTRYATESTPIKKYNYDNQLSFEDHKKIEKLEMLTQEHGATEGEENNAKAFIEKIKNNKSDKPEYTITGYTIAHMANPGRCKWHIEKDGSIYDKGTGITKYSEVPDEWIFDINTMQFKDGYKTWGKRGLNESQLKAVKDLKKLILRWERVVNSMNGMGDGTKETEEAAQKQQTNEKMEKVIKKVTKKVKKMVEVKRDYFKVGDYITISYHGHFWKITNENMYKGKWKGIEESRKVFIYELVGAASRGYQDLKSPKSYYQYEYQMLSQLKKGDIKIYELKEIEETKEVEKWIRVKTPKAKKQTVKDDIKETKEESKNKTTNNTNDTMTAVITMNQEKNGIEIRFSVKPNTEIRTEMKSNGFRWGGIKNNCWYAKQSDNTIKFANDLVDKINNNIDDVTDEAINNITIKGILKNNNEVNSTQQREKQIDYTKLLGKINKQIESNNKTIEQYSGDYKVNTSKRMREQEGRDLKIKTYKCDNSILEYLKTKVDNSTITEFEQNLTNKTFRNDIDLYYRKSLDTKNTAISKIKFPEYRQDWGMDNWYNIDVTKKIKRFNKANIHNTNNLLKVIDEYKNIVDTINSNNTIDLRTEKIKKLEREYKMQQKGDINFTSKNVVKQLINYADIKESDKILEPSAGIGNIVDQLKQYSNNIDVCEYQYSYAELLKLKGYNIICNDFMKCDNYNTYDKIVMNPPFSKNQDTQHVKQAYKCLKNNGKLVAITSNH